MSGSGGLADYEKNIRIKTGSVAANLIGGPGTIASNRVPSTGGAGTPTRNAGSILRGTFAVAREPSFNSAWVGTLDNLRLPRNITVGTLVGLSSAGSLNRGTVPASRIPTSVGTLAGARNAGSIVRGTLGNLRLPRNITVGTVSGLLDAGSLNRGTAPVARMPSLGGAYVGTLANARLPRDITVGTLSGLSDAGSLNRGTVPSGRAPSLSSGYIGTLPNVRLPRNITVGTIAGLLNAGSLNRGTIPSARLQLLQNIPGTLPIPTKTSGSLNVSNRAFGTLAATRVPTIANLVGTLPNSKEPRNITVGTVSGLFDAGSANRGTLPSGRAPSLGAGYIGTLPNARLPRNITVGTLSGVFNAGSLNRGTVPSGRAPSLGAGYIGTLPNSRLPRNITVGTLSGLSNAGSLNRGSVPTNRYISSGTLAGARNAGSLVRGSLGLNRGAGVLGSILKQRIIAVSMPGVRIEAGSFIRTYHLVVPSGMKLKVWQMGIKQTSGSAGTGPLVAKVYSESQGTPYRRGSAQYFVGSPLAKVPAGTRVSFRLENSLNIFRNVTGYFFATLE